MYPPDIYCQKSSLISIPYSSTDIYWTKSVLNEIYTYIHPTFSGQKWLLTKFYICIPDI
nr:MAG TPA: hypothetical protein [Caudoviricetes sp.]DAQ07147.1 MAG TPA: hypothetical protein [Caudoviricetes sp.]